jgi:hypothetical protein
VTEGVSHWDDAKSWRAERGHIAGTWWSLTRHASDRTGIKRIQVDPGKWSTPLHLEGSEEEIFYVLDGSGSRSRRTRARSWRRTTCEQAIASSTFPWSTRTRRRPVRKASTCSHFGERHLAANTLLPNAGVSWLGPTWVLAGAEEDHPGRVRRPRGRPAST